jgi:hypothetical protein
MGGGEEWVIITYCEEMYILGNCQEQSNQISRAELLDMMPTEAESLT